MNFSRIIQGCMTWGAWGKQLDTEQMIAMIHHCIDQGITTFDHADIYGDYTTEEEWGHAFAKAKIPRDQIQLISKCGIQMKGDARPENTIKHYQYDTAYIIKSVERSLKKLQVDYLDLFLLHRPSPLMHPDQIAEAVTHLRGQGKIKAFGVSNFTPPQMALIASKSEIAGNQIEISLTERSSLTDGTIDYMMQEDIVPMSWSPLGSVFREDTPQNRRIKNKLNTLKEKYSATPDQLLLAWLLRHPSKIHPVIGTTTKERISNAVKATEIALELKDWFELLEASVGEEVA